MQQSTKAPPAHESRQALSPPSSDTKPGRSRPMSVVRVVQAVVGTSVVLLMWELAMRAGIVHSSQVAGPVATLRRTILLFGDREFLTHMGVTLQVWLYAMLLSVLIAVPIGIAFGYYTVLYRSTEAVVHALRSVPATALIPVSVLLLGLGVVMQVWLTIFAIVWPILFNTMYGVHNTERQLLMVAHHLRWRPWQKMIRVVLPSASGYIMSGVRIAAGLAMVVVVSVELIAAESGIGTYMMRYQNAGLPDYVYASIFVSGMVGALLYSGLAKAESLLLPWALRERSAQW